MGRLIFNNPDNRNAVSTEMWRAIPVILDVFEADPDIRVLVVSGAGGKAVIAGDDIKGFDKTRASRHQAETLEPVGGCARADAQLSKAGHCHDTRVLPWRWRQRGTVLRPPDRLSQCPVRHSCRTTGYGAGGLVPLMAVVGPAVAKEILFTARRYPAAEARALGFVNRVVPDDQLESFVADYARAIADNPPMTVAAAKRIVNELVKEPARRDLEVAQDLGMRCFDSDDYKEGRLAFREKRPPRFVGR